jgi:regulator of RNase E activity RraA
VGQVSPARHAGSVDIFLEAIDKAAPGDVLVADNGGRPDESCIGDLIALEAQAAGLAGIVIWGLHRDAAQDSADRAAGLQPGGDPRRPPAPRPQAPGALDSATVGNWAVDHADLALADDDGVLFVPAARAHDIFTLAETICGTEQRQADRIRAGDTLRSRSSSTPTSPSASRHPR